MQSQLPKEWLQQGKQPRQLRFNGTPLTPQLSCRNRTSTSRSVRVSRRQRYRSRKTLKKQHQLARTPNKFNIPWVCWFPGKGHHSGKGERRGERCSARRATEIIPPSLEPMNASKIRDKRDSSISSVTIMVTGLYPFCICYE